LKLSFKKYQKNDPISAALLLMLPLLCQSPVLPRGLNRQKPIALSLPNHATHQHFL
jgi:hypothetical protein